MLYEITKVRFQAEKEIKDLNEMIAYVSQDLKRLEKESN
jgi:hypothetical protein